MVSQKHWRLESLLRLVLVLVACILAGAMVAGTLRRTLGDSRFDRDLLPMIISLVSLHGAAFLGVVLFVRAHRTSWAEAFGFRNEPGWAVALGISVTVIVLPACWWLQVHLTPWIKYVGFEVDEQEAVRFLRLADTLWKQILMGGFAIVVAPVVEELLFRGVAYPALKQAGYPRTAFWGTVLLFALIHGSVAVLIPLAFLAIILTLLYEWTDNLLACIAVHSLFNAANFVLLLAGPYLESLPHK